eukprot:GHVN01064125.1.p1 GENE.GHVN01064125.1~~GHVN01064125.1.p1  ORF type:complete len:101 (-),score=12.38 GHVN01064125.1:192-494(-)
MNLAATSLFCLLFSLCGSSSAQTVTRYSSALVAFGTSGSILRDAMYSKIASPEVLSVGLPSPKGTGLSSTVIGSLVSGSVKAHTQAKKSSLTTHSQITHS